MGPNALRWDREPGHYEVYYVSLTDPKSGVGLWIRYTMVAPLDGPATCSLWFLAMDPQDPSANVGRKVSFPAEELSATAEPFELRVDGSTLSDRGVRGGFDDISWDLTWQPGRAHEHVHPLLQKAKIAKTVLVLPHADVEISGTVSYGGRGLRLDRARGGQAHLWGSKHAQRWAWAHCNDFETVAGEPRPDTFVDGVSVYVPRFGREIGPNTPVVGRFAGQDFASTSPLHVTRNPSTFALTSWNFEARDGQRRIVGTVTAEREDLVGVTYHDPDGDLAYCYNSEIASMRLAVWDSERLVEDLVSPCRAHFEYAQREKLTDLPLKVT
jgi:hypothetical protein